MLRKLFNRFVRRPVIYDGNFFAEAWFHEWQDLRMVLASLIESEAKWHAILDFGCGPGAMIDLMTDRGLNYMGCDYSVEARQLYLKHYGKYPDNYVPSLNETDLKTYDLFLAFDVLEHMRDDEISILIERIRVIPELLFNISRARGIPGHINIKSDRTWIYHMEKLGYYFEERRTLALRKLYTQERSGSPDHWDRNLFLFSRFDS